MTCADFRMTLTTGHVRRLLAAGFLPAEPECPGDLRDALHAVLAALPMPSSATPTHERRAA
jgi:hypothetical protein